MKSVTEGFFPTKLGQLVPESVMTVYMYVL